MFNIFTSFNPYCFNPSHFLSFMFSLCFYFIFLYSKQSHVLLFLCFPALILIAIMLPTLSLIFPSLLSFFIIIFLHLRLRYGLLFPCFNPHCFNALSDVSLSYLIFLSHLRQRYVLLFLCLQGHFSLSASNYCATSLLTPSTVGYGNGCICK